MDWASDHRDVKKLPTTWSYKANKILLDQGWDSNHKPPNMLVGKLTISPFFYSCFMITTLDFMYLMFLVFSIYIIYRLFKSG